MFNIFLVNTIKPREQMIFARVCVWTHRLVNIKWVIEGKNYRAQETKKKKSVNWKDNESRLLPTNMHKDSPPMDPCLERIKGYIQYLITCYQMLSAGFSLQSKMSEI